jgi:hypothetical protein
MAANWEDTRKCYQDIARRFLHDRDYPQEAIDEDLKTEVELYLFVALVIFLDVIVQKVTFNFYVCYPSSVEIKM